ncbi:MAG: hypothetical protein ACLU8D_05125 [Enterocloster sp.]
MPPITWTAFFQPEELIQLGSTAGLDCLGVIEASLGYVTMAWAAVRTGPALEVAEPPYAVILVADAQGRSFSTLAACPGLFKFRPDSHIKGVLFNWLSPYCTRPLNGGRGRAGDPGRGCAAVGREFG